MVGVQSEAAPSMARSWREGRVVETPEAATYAEGIATRVPVPDALTLMDGRVDEMLLVGEGDLRAAQATLTAPARAHRGGLRRGVVGGPAGRSRSAAGCSLVIVTGGNVAGPAA